MTSVEKLRRQAAKARRLAAGLSDAMAKEALLAYAEEAEAHAARTEEHQGRRLEGGDA